MSDVKRWPTKDELEAMSVAERSQYIREHAIAALPTAKRLLAEATPLPWKYGDVSDGYLPAGGEDTALIVYAVNHLPDYEAAVEALIGLSVAQVDGLACWCSVRFGPHVERCDKARTALARLRESVPA